MSYNTGWLFYVYRHMHFEIQTSNYLDSSYSEAQNIHHERFKPRRYRRILETSCVRRFKAVSLSLLCGPVDCPCTFISDTCALARFFNV